MARNNNGNNNKNSGNKNSGNKNQATNTGGGGGNSGGGGNKNQKVPAWQEYDAGNKFKRDDLKELQKDKKITNNQILQIAGGSKKVGSRASGDLMKINPGISLPTNPWDAGTSGGSGITNMMKPWVGAEQEYKVGQQVQGLGKNYLQWNGTDAKGKPLAVGGYKIPKEMRKGNPGLAGRMAYNKGVDGLYLGRNANTLLNQKGGMRNRPINLAGSALDRAGGDYVGNGGSNGGGGGGNKGGGGGGNKGGGKDGNKGSGIGEIGTEDLGTGQTAPGSYGPGGPSSYVDGNATGFRRRKSSARLAGLTSKGTSQFKITGQTGKSSGLNIGYV